MNRPGDQADRPENQQGCQDPAHLPGAANALAPQNVARWWCGDETVPGLFRPGARRSPAVVVAAIIVIKNIISVVITRREKVELRPRDVDWRLDVAGRS